MGTAGGRSVVLISRSCERGTTSSPVPPVPKSFIHPGSRRPRTQRRDKGQGTWDMGCGAEAFSFMPECLNGIEPCRFDGGEHAEDQADSAGEAERHRQCPAGNMCVFQVRVGNLGNGHG